MGGAVTSQGYIEKFRTDVTRRLRGVFHFMMFYVRSHLIQALAVRSPAWIRSCKPFVRCLKEVCKVSRSRLDFTFLR